MSTSHHGNPEEAENERRLLAQFLNRAQPNFPAGKMHQSDEGELAFAIAHDDRKGVVIIKFGKPVDWLGLRKQDAIQLSQLLLEHANQLKEA